MIGIFDSGSGGLTVLRALRSELPFADVLYFGDIRNVPYGAKTPTELSHLTLQGMKFLKARGATRIVNACNTMSSSLSVSMVELLSVAPNDIVEMVGPTVAFFKNSSLRLALVATPATIHSGIYQDAFSLIGKTVAAVAIPDLAADIEFDRDTAAMKEKIKAAFSGFDFSAVDVFILACTHYPLIANLFRSAIPESVALFDPAEAVAERAKERFWPQEVMNGEVSFFISADSPAFRKRAAELFPGSDFPVEVLE